MIVIKNHWGFRLYKPAQWRRDGYRFLFCLSIWWNSFLLVDQTYEHTCICYELFYYSLSSTDQWGSSSREVTGNQWEKRSRNGERKSCIYGYKIIFIQGSIFSSVYSFISGGAEGSQKDARDAAKLSREYVAAELSPEGIVSESKFLRLDSLHELVKALILESRPAEGSRFTLALIL